MCWISSENDFVPGCVFWGGKQGCLGKAVHEECSEVVLLIMQKSTPSGCCPAFPLTKGFPAVQRTFCHLLLYRFWEKCMGGVHTCTKILFIAVEMGTGVVSETESGAGWHVAL